MPTNQRKIFIEEPNSSNMIDLSKIMKWSGSDRIAARTLYSPPKNQNSSDMINVGMVMGLTGNDTITSITLYSPSKNQDVRI